MTTLYVTESGSFIKRKGGHVIVGRNHEVLFEVPFESIDDVTVFDSVHISSSLLTDFISNGIPVTWLSGYGKYFGTLINTNTVDIHKHQRQFTIRGDKEFCLALSKKLINAKINNQLTILRRYERNLLDDSVMMSINNICHIRKNIHKATSIEELMGYEGIISRLYFEGLGKIVPFEFTFTKRSKQPPLDPFNAMLGLGYSMLFNEIMAGVINAGLHPFVGCMHSIKGGHPALVSDLIEEWRAPVIDSLVLNLVKRKMIDVEEEFQYSGEGCYLNGEGRKLFLSAYNKKIKSMNQYMDRGQTFRESIYSQCKAYASTIMNIDLERYIPLEIR